MFDSSRPESNFYFDEEPAMPEPPNPPLELEGAPVAEIEAPPEFAGAPYSDEMFGNLHLGPDYPALKAKFEDPNLPELEKQRVAWQIASLHVQAAERNAWWDGPLNTRRTVAPTPSEIPEPENPPFVDDSPNNSDLDVNLDELPEIDESELLDEKPGTEDPTVLVMNPPEEPPVEEKGNWLQKRLRKFKKGVEDFADYTNRHRTESKVLAFVGGFAGMGSAITGAFAAQGAIAAGAGFLAGPGGIATALAVNYFGFSKIFHIWSESKAKKEATNFSAQSDKTSEQYLRDVESDHRGRVKAFAYGDIVGKLVSGTYLRGLLVHPSPEHASVGEKVIDQKGSLGSHSADRTPPSFEHPPSIPELPVHVEHFVVNNDLDQWEEILYHYDLDPYSQDMVDTLSLNHDRILEMWRHWAENRPDGMIRIEMGPDAQMTPMSIPDAQAMLERVIARGYPTLEKAGGDPQLYQLWQAELERMTKTLLPGTEVLIPTK